MVNAAQQQQTDEKGGPQLSPEGMAPCAANSAAAASFRQRLSRVGRDDKAALSERLNGCTRKHWIYLVPVDPHEKEGSRGAGRVATGFEDDLAPCTLNVSDQTMATLRSQPARKAFSVVTRMQGEQVVTRMPRLTAKLLERIDCKTPLFQLLDEVAAADDEAAQARDGDGTRLTARAMRREWEAFYKPLDDLGGFLFMSDLHSSTSTVSKPTT